MSIPPPPRKRGSIFHLPVNQVICGSNIEVVSNWPADCVDSIVTDPPYGLGFMGKEWDTFKQENVSRPKTTKLVYKTDYINGVPVKRKKPEIVTRDSGARRAGSYDLSRNPEFQQWFTQWAKAMLRITKPGGFLLCFGGTRTFHRLTCAIEDAGWEIRDCMMWLYGSGFPKSHDISKAIDKQKFNEWLKANPEQATKYHEQIKQAAGNSKTISHVENKYKEMAGVKPKKVGTKKQSGAKFKLTQKLIDNGGFNDPNRKKFDITIPASDLAQLWNGYGTALKPAWEPIIVAMKPKEGSFADNAEKYGVAGLNIDGGRIQHDEKCKMMKAQIDKQSMTGDGKYGQAGRHQDVLELKPQGRWPANLILDKEAGRMLDEQSGKVSYGKKKGGYKYQGKKYQVDGFVKDCKPQAPSNYADSGGASRFFYCAKTSRKERDLGCENQKNTHPTIKPLALTKYLCTLLKMPDHNQIILDPFLGSGTIAMACKELGIDYIGIEKEQEYCEIAKRRIAAIKS